ncbi:MAG: hypothetical protein JNM27_21265 [Leptospirales bacterium]|nr:hypothetical protein [Leptospirales bacterium]
MDKTTVSILMLSLGALLAFFRWRRHKRARLRDQNQLNNQQIELRKTRSLSVPQKFPRKTIPEILGNAPPREVTPVVKAFRKEITLRTFQVTLSCLPTFIALGISISLGKSLLESVGITIIVFAFQVPFLYYSVPLLVAQWSQRRRLLNIFYTGQARYGRVTNVSFTDAVVETFGNRRNLIVGKKVFEIAFWDLTQSRILHSKFGPAPQTTPLETGNCAWLLYNELEGECALYVGHDEFHCGKILESARTAHNNK